MELIQFRKDVRHKPVEGHPRITQTVYVTQYRQRVMQSNGSIYDNGAKKDIPLFSVTEEWTDWQDFPL